MHSRKGSIITTALLLLVQAGVASAQTAPWVLFDDALSVSSCDTINAANAQLVLLEDTNQLVIVTGRDVVLEDSFVDFDGDVFILGESFGFIDFDDDIDGLRSLWWISLTGRVIEVDGFTGEPFETLLFPSNVVEPACDACEFWDDLALCDALLGFDDPLSPLIPNFCGLGAGAGVVGSIMGLFGTGVVRRRWRRAP